MRQVPIPNVNFILSPALGSISGFVAAPTGGAPLILPFNSGGKQNVDAPGAALILNKQGNIPQGNPLGDIESATAADGSFSVKGLASGVYDMWVLAKNYGSVTKKNIAVGNINIDVGTMTMIPGYKLSGKISKADNTTINTNEFDTLVGV